MEWGSQLGIGAADIANETNTDEFNSNVEFFAVQVKLRLCSWSAANLAWAQGKVANQSAPKGFHMDGEAVGALQLSVCNKTEVKRLILADSDSRNHP